FAGGCLRPGAAGDYLRRIPEQAGLRGSRGRPYRRIDLRHLGDRSGHLDEGGRPGPTATEAWSPSAIPREPPVRPGRAAGGSRGGRSLPQHGGSEPASVIAVAIAMSIATGASNGEQRGARSAR